MVTMPKAKTDDGEDSDDSVDEKGNRKYKKKQEQIGVFGNKR